MHRFYLKIALLSSVLLFSGFAFAQSPSIANVVSPTTLCIGDTMTIIFETSDTFAPDNVFTIELSNDSGSFAEPDTIATIEGQTGDTVYYATPTLPPGSLYAVRVLSSDPPVIGVPTINTLTVRKQLPPPNIQLTPAGSVYNTCTHDSVNLKFSADTNILFTWYFNDSLFNNPNKYFLTDKDSGTFIIEYFDTALNGCSRGFDTLLVAIHAYPPKPAIADSGSPNLCGNGTVKLTTRNNPNFTYQWQVLAGSDTSNVTGATDTTYRAPSSGLYRVSAYNSVCAAASSPIQVNIDSNPLVTFTLPFDSFCNNSPPISLVGGSPAGGDYYSLDSGFVNGSLFEPGNSGAGTFTVYYTYSNSIGCKGVASTQISVYNCTTSGIADVAKQLNLAMYPNPASGSVVISSGTNSVKQLRLINLMGQEVSHQTFTQQLIYNTAKLPSGIYMVEVTDAASSEKSVQRLIVQ